MTTFTTEDRVEFQKTSEPTWEERWGSWTKYIINGWSNQENIEYFWPLTEQVELGLDYTDCEGVRYSYSDVDINSGQVLRFDGTGTTWTTAINPSLTVTPVNSVGELSIGGINIGLDTKPNIIQRALHKLLGFDWKDK